MKVKTVFAIALITIIAAGCIKTKTCNIAIEEEEKSWFPYDSTDKSLYVSKQDSNVLELTFSRFFYSADDEVTEGNQCLANAVNYINITDSSGNTSLIGQYRLFKRETSAGQITQSTITFGNLDFYQQDYQDSTLRLSRNNNPLQKLDTLTIGDSTYRNVQTLASDTSLFTHASFKNIYFSRDFEILKFILGPGDEEEVYELRLMD
ncbi:MAG: hypothetical protein K9J27_04150 [Bacteroidales bacterium]|nr:hypothetical protein [Bacteroidales bacterium]MCF8334613.1 hypothetical protein [Bacteroidales bacterium]